MNGNIKRSSENKNLWISDDLVHYQITPNATIPFYTFPHLLQPTPSAVRRERVGERVALRTTRLCFFPNKKATPILAFPRQTGEGTGLLMR